MRMLMFCSFLIACVQCLPHALLGADHHHEQVRPGAEILGFVADHQPVKIIQAVQRFGDHVEDIIIERIHLGMELQQATPSPMS